MSRQVIQLCFAVQELVNPFLGSIMDDQRDPMFVLDWCVYDYLMGRNMNHLAEQFATEANVNVFGMDSEGYLTDWWLLCWELYHNRRTRPRAMEEQHIQGTRINTNQFPTTNPMQMPSLNQFPSNMHLSSPVQSVASQAYSRIPPPSIDQGNMQMPQTNQQSRGFVPSNMNLGSLGSNMNSRVLNVDRSVDPGNGQQFNNESIQQQDEHATGMEMNVSVNLPLVPIPNAIEFTFQEAGRLYSFPGKIVCCEFSPNGKLFASGGHDKKVTIWNMESCNYISPAEEHNQLIWNMESCNYISTAEEHNQLITDVRFGTDSTVFATSSFDRTVRLWDSNNVTKSIVKLDGHAERVTSLDFHSQRNLICSCDIGGGIRLWDVEKCLCSGVLQGASRKIRFMPGSVNLLAAAYGNMIGMLDTNSNKFQFYLQGHVREVSTLCWDSTGSYLLSVSEDSTRIWSPLNSTRSVHVLPSDGIKFGSCTFHPGYPQRVVIGSYQKLILWNPSEMNRVMEVPGAHEGLITSMTNSSVTRLMASGGDDKCLKFWR